LISRILATFFAVILIIDFIGDLGYFEVHYRKTGDVHPFMQIDGDRHMIWFNVMRATRLIIWLGDGWIKWEVW
jgi:hypothetical protein